jgi:hypothetical protein
MGTRLPRSSSVSPDQPEAPRRAQPPEPELVRTDVVGPSDRPRRPGEIIEDLRQADPGGDGRAPRLQAEIKGVGVDELRVDAEQVVVTAWHAAGHPDGSRPRQILDISDAGRLLERIARIVEITHKTRQEQTISLDTFKRLMDQMALVVTRFVADADALRAIEQAWGEIRVDGRLDRR